MNHIYQLPIPNTKLFVATKNSFRKGCHRCLVIYEKHKNVLQYKESECEGDSMYMHQSNPSALAMRSSNKQSDHRGSSSQYERAFKTIFIGSVHNEIQ